MKRVSPKIAARVKERRERYADSRNVCFDELAFVLSIPKIWWPETRIVEDDYVLSEFRWFMKPCPLCGNVTALEPHHLVGGSGGRSHEPANLIAICRACHELVQSNAAETKRVWLAKWRTDRWHTDWCRLACLLGRIPDFDSLD